MVDRNARALPGPLKRSLRHEEWAERKPWLVPLLYVALAAALGLRGPELGSRLLGPLVSPIGSGGAIALLSAIASGMMAFTGIVFSLVFVALQFGSSSYSPRLLRVLPARRLLWHAMGVFAGTFLYALLAIRAADLAGREGINAVAVWVGLTWLVASIVLLAFLVPAVQGLSIARVLPLLGRRGAEAVGRVYPRPFDPRRPPRLVLEPGRARRLVRNEGRPGYLAAIDEVGLVEAAREAGGALLIQHAIGDYLAHGEPLALAVGGRPEIAASRAGRCLLVASDRLIETDPAYALRLLVDAAIRALSPAINDPTTAVMVLDQIEPLLRSLGAADLEVGRVCDAEGTLRLVYPTSSWEDLLLLGLAEIQQYGRDSIAVERRLGALLESLGPWLPEPRRGALRRFAARRRERIREAFGGSGSAAEAEQADRQGLGHGERRADSP
ncbi:MAG TPA: hypothetical protein DFS52_07010 [Myxococcales bacterium]|nr:hypothetical protein [Myxococcales bacterium]